MGIIVNDQPAGPPKKFPLPSEGVQLIVLADVEDLGIQENEQFGPRREVALSWVINEQDTEGNYFVIRRRYTASMNPGSNLFADIRDMVGKNPPAELDLERLLGHVNLGAIKHAIGTRGRNAGKTFANITTFYTPKPGDKFAIPKDFVRAKDGGFYGRPKKQQQPRGSAAVAGGTGKPAPASAPELADEDIPF